MGKKKTFVAAGFVVPAVLGVLLIPFSHLPVFQIVVSWLAAIRMNNSADPDFIAGACKFLWGLAMANPGSKNFFVYTGSLDAVVAVLRRFPDHKALQRQCTDAVSQMSMFSLFVQQEAGKRGAVELVIDMFRRWSEDPDMQRGGMSGCFMDFSPENRLRFQRHGGIEVLMDVFRNHYNNSEAVVGSWYAFSSGTQPPNIEPFVRAGGLEWAVRCMRDHAKSYRVREEVMQALRSPLGVTSVRNSAADAGFIELLAQTMVDHPMDYHQVDPACALLSTFASLNKTHRDIAHKAGATRLALQAVIDFPKMRPTVEWAAEYDQQYTVYDDCMKYLTTVLGLCDAHQYLLDAHAIEVVKGILAERIARSPSGVGDMAGFGWNSQDRLVFRYGQELIRKLSQPCQPFDGDMPYALDWYQ